MKFQEGKQLKIAPHLTRKHIQPTQYEKMRVRTAAQVKLLRRYQSYLKSWFLIFKVLSHGTASGIRTMVESGDLKTESLSTAFFCQYFNNWFDIMNARHGGEAMFANDTQKSEFLREVGDAT